MTAKPSDARRGSASASPHPDPDALERAVLHLWEEERTFAESLKRREASPPYSFYDGPPYATGSPHYGNILQTVIKDTVTRYWTMRGYRVDRRVGWDCHGLPVENLVERELGIADKRDIEKLGIDRFNAACRASVFRAVGEFQRVLKRMGRWADYENAYATLDPSYIESVWWVFKQVWDAGLVYAGFRSSPYCPRCATPLSNFETALGYKETDDPSVVVKLPLLDVPATFLLVWTTTPWTLPANVAVAVHPDLRYVRVKVGDEHWILARDRLAEVVERATEILEEYRGVQLAGMRYRPPYAFLPVEKPAHRVVTASFVSALEGTGIVHMAPAFGEDDLKTAEAEDLPILRTVDEYGRFIDAVTPWAGLPVRDADARIIADLTSRNLVARAGTVRHPYPFCWRCDTPLIYYATTSWFIAVSKIRERLLANNEKIHWVPAHLKHGRFGQGLKDAPDWAVSRSRYWGTPIPVWVCGDCGENTVIGSLRELEERGADMTPLSPNGTGKERDLHRPHIDTVTFPCPACAGSATRVPEVFDVWMDSGSMPYAQWHYPFENARRVEETFPADFVGEALEQTRGWFYTLHVLAAILTLTDRGLGKDQPAFRHAVASGLILAEDGKKLSKRLKNYPAVEEVVRTYGADTLRLYLLSSTAIGSDTTLSEALIGEFYRAYTLPLLNVLSFFETYARLAGWTGGAAAPSAGASVLDRWILARTGRLVQVVRRAMDDYRLDEASRAVVAFVEDLSNWYVRRSRKRFAGGDAGDRRAAFATLEQVLVTFSFVTAPMTPFFAEHMMRKVRPGRSPHLGDFPPVPDVDEEILAHMASLRAIVSAGLKLRAQARIKVRQPLRELVVVGDLPFDLADVASPWRHLVLEEVNVKRVRVLDDASGAGSYVWSNLPGGLTVGLNAELDDDLVREGIVRDLIRHTQEARKAAGLTLHDTIAVSVASDDPGVADALRRFKDLYLSETRAAELVETLEKADGEHKGTVHGKPVVIRLRKT